MTKKSKLVFISDEDFKKGQIKGNKSKYPDLVRFVEQNKDKGWVDVVEIVKNLVPDVYVEIYAKSEKKAIPSTCASWLGAYLRISRKMRISIRQSDTMPSGYGIKFIGDGYRTIEPIKGPEIKELEHDEEVDYSADPLAGY